MPNSLSIFNQAYELNLPPNSLPSYYKQLKKYHLQHHFADYNNGFGVSSRFWDKVFGTELPPLQPVKVE